MSNRFRDPLLRAQYDAMLSAFRARHHQLIYPDGKRCRGNGAADPSTYAYPVSHTGAR